MRKIEDYNKSIFEKIKKIDENGNEYWLARELSVVLQYSELSEGEKRIYRRN